MGITIQQLSVFLENREGRLDEVLSVLAGNDVNIVALRIRIKEKRYSETTVLLQC